MHSIIPLNTYNEKNVYRLDKKRQITNTKVPNPW